MGCRGVDKGTGEMMTVKELIEKLEQLNPDATVYTMAHDDDIALIVTDVSANVLVGKEKTVLIF